MNYLKSYNSCILCGSKKLIRNKTQYQKNNFYLDAVKADLKINNNYLKKIKLFRCDNCNILQHNPWFNENIAFKIFNNIYGQHNKSWTNIINFVKKGSVPDHGDLFSYISKKLKIKNYAEFNGPFMGLFLNFFKNQNKINIKLYRKLFENIIKYINSRQVAGQPKKYQKRKYHESLIYKKKINEIKLNLKIKNKRNPIQYFFYDNSILSWNYNDNYKSVNSKVFLNEFTNVNIMNINNFEKKIKFDLFGIFLTLDHTLEPRKILDFALSNSKIVIVYCHVNKEVTKQHLFSLTNEFRQYLKKNNIYNIDISNLVNKKFKSPELYLMCSKNKKLLNNFK